MARTIGAKDKRERKRIENHYNTIGKGAAYGFAAGSGFGAGGSVTDAAIEAFRHRKNMNPTLAMDLAKGLPVKTLKAGLVGLGLGALAGAVKGNIDYYKDKANEYNLPINKIKRRIDSIREYNINYDDLADFARGRDKQKRKPRGFWGRVGHDAKVGALVGGGLLTATLVPGALKQVAMQYGKANSIPEKLARVAGAGIAASGMGAVGGGLVGSGVGAIRSLYKKDKNR